ncbi:MAG: hypothetical protein QE495_14050 [Acidovorax sp.]|uniref:hypothetical protein n=1 Tax=Acidovorax sp. TaxID=1872122 RepID=UPI002614C3D1|nr:hypothetical protein [Acidovorax sp.]MDH4427572.1 hypothetical protein [Acidovorax sp.]
MPSGLPPFLTRSQHFGCARQHGGVGIVAREFKVDMDVAAPVDHLARHGRCGGIPGLGLDESNKDHHTTGGKTANQCRGRTTWGHEQIHKG